MTCTSLSSSPTHAEATLDQRPADPEKSGVFENITSLRPSSPTTPRASALTAPTSMAMPRLGRELGTAAAITLSQATQVAAATVTTYDISGSGVVITEQTVLDRVVGTGWGTQTTINGDGVHQQAQGDFATQEVAITGDGIHGDLDLHAPRAGDIEDPTCFEDYFEAVGNVVSAVDLSCITETLTTGASAAAQVFGEILNIAGECIGCCCGILGAFG